VRILYAFDAKLGHNAILGDFWIFVGMFLENEYDRVSWGEVGAIWGTLGHFGAFWGLNRSRFPHLNSCLLPIGRYTECAPHYVESASHMNVSLLLLPIYTT
jgi:hypothetical protein